MTSIDGKPKHIGLFDSLIDAALAVKNTRQVAGYHANHGDAHL